MFIKQTNVLDLHYILENSLQKIQRFFDNQNNILASFKTLDIICPNLVKT